MQVRHTVSPKDMAGYDTARLREEFLVEKVYVPGEIRTVYSHEDRTVVGGAVPLPGQPLRLPAYDPLRADYFCERRELAVVNVGGSGTVVADGTVYPLGHRDVLYVGRGTREVEFSSAAADADGALFYLFSAVSHTILPTKLITSADALRNETGDAATANRRKVEKYIHADGASSSQIVLGITSLEQGSVWNTMPPHTHDRRTEIYHYFDLADDARIVHLLGEPHETRHMIVQNEQVVISPSWSIHSGAGTSNYAFVWAMAGENQGFADMDHVAVTELR